MTDTDKLQRRYRRLLALYPQAFRDRHEQEMLGVLMDGRAGSGARPGIRETLNLLAGAVVLRLRHTAIPGEWEHAHARVMRPVRFVIGLWLTFLSVVLIVLSSEPEWAVLTGAFALVHFSLVYRLRGDTATPA